MILFYSIVTYTNVTSTVCKMVLGENIIRYLLNSFPSSKKFKLYPDWNLCYINLHIKLDIGYDFMQEGKVFLDKFSIRYLVI